MLQFILAASKIAQTYSPKSGQKVTGNMKLLMLGSDKPVPWIAVHPSCIL
jgi:hypothetical protein